MTHASLFSGIGGFDLAAEWAGWTNAFNCEIDPFCRKILKYHFPDAKQYGDIRTTDFAVWRDRIDVLTGGFPCQPFSLAGKRKGTEDDRYLWPEMLRVDRLSIGSLTFIAADVEYCVTRAEQEAEERIRAKAHKIVKEMMEGVFQGNMPQNIADEFIQKLNEK